MAEPQPNAGAGVTSKSIDQRFDDVTQAFLDQRDYTTFCFNKLRTELRREIRGAVAASEGRLTRRLDRHELILGEILSEVKAHRQERNG